METAPQYSYPAPLLAGLLGDLILGRLRSFRKDALLCVARLDPPPQVIHPENIPQAGGCVILVNHYYRPGFAAQWLAIALSAVVTLDIHWIMTEELTYPGRWFAPAGRLISRAVLQRGAHVYGFTPMPPMPPRPGDVERRAASVRAVLDYARHTRAPVIGLAPEGGDQGRGRLAEPAPGLGRFALLLAGLGLSFSPVGVYESDRRLCLDFGRAFELAIPPERTPDEKDRLAARMIMTGLAACLPTGLRGAYA